MTSERVLPTSNARRVSAARVVAGGIGEQGLHAEALTLLDECTPTGICRSRGRIGGTGRILRGNGAREDVCVHEAQPRRPEPEPRRTRTETRAVPRRRFDRGGPCCGHAREPVGWSDSVSRRRADRESRIVGSLRARVGQSDQALQGASIRQSDPAIPAWYGTRITGVPSNRTIRSRLRGGNSRMIRLSRRCRCRAVGSSDSRWAWRMSRTIRPVAAERA